MAREASDQEAIRWIDAELQKPGADGYVRPPHREAHREAHAQSVSRRPQAAGGVAGSLPSSAWSDILLPVVRTRSERVREQHY